MSGPVRGNTATDIARARTLARLLDEAVAIPGTRIRVGLDALLGLLPIGGDLIGALLSAGTIALAARAGAPPAVLLRMAATVAVDTVAGTIPVLGDLFDVAYRANSRNLRLLEEWSATPVRATRSSRAVLLLIVVALLLLVAGAAMVAVAAARWLWALVSQ